MTRRDSFDNRIDEVSLWEATDELTAFDIEMGLGASISWDLPPAYRCIIRSKHPITGKVIEKAYRQPSAAKKHLATCFCDNHDDVIIMTDEALHAPAHDL